MIISIALYCIEKQYQKIYGWCIEKYLDRKMIQDVLWLCQALVVYWTIAMLTRISLGSGSQAQVYNMIRLTRTNDEMSLLSVCPDCLSVYPDCLSV